MKIFGKKRKHSAGSAAASASSNARDAAADAVVLKLLQDKPDPATRNAKERRLVKRYEDRQMQQQQTEGAEGKETLTAEPEKMEDATVTESQQSGDDDDEEEDHEEEEDNDDDDDDDDASGNETARKSLNMFEEKNAPESINANAGDDIKEEATATAPTSALPQEVLALLNQIPSKQRRKLVRQWERGEAAVAQVEEQARDILAPSSSKTVAGEATANAAVDADDTPKAKRRRKTIDETLLSPEERLRRQEQRRLQQEARDKQASEGDSKTTSTTKRRHPLNSERRRANRRKPKWEKKPAATTGGPTSYKSEHASSGYQMRRSQKAGE